ncbi:MAG: UDP-N-acetylmuramoyl-L-alanyl-D-glutamate--2,6-diaminopimelate ligase [Longimicrobiales bacterium]
MSATLPVTLDAVSDVLRSAGLLTEARATGDVAVRGVSQDSRATRAGDLFLAWAGTAADAHDFVPEAVRQGAVATVVERRLAIDVPQLVVRDGRRAAALAADVVLGYPSRRLRAFGVTGTNGKTTTAILIRHLMGPEVPTAVIGTLGLIDQRGVRAGSEKLTTPGPVQVAVWLRELADGGLSAVVFEASSHALAQHRLDALKFEVVVFTNLSQDHLDYHADLAEYFAAKARLVELAAEHGTVVVNRDDRAWDRLDTLRHRVRTFGIDRAADVSAHDLRLDAHGASFTLRVDGEERRVRTPLVARHNVENALAATAAALAAGVSLDRVVERLGTAPQVSGRLEAVVTEPFTVLIDFAHTPAALASALVAVKPLTRGRLIVLFGAGGDRDRAKRRPMAEAVARVADLIVLTSDNPRTEDPERILDDLAEGLAGVEYRRVSDRRAAIEAALQMARPGDTVVLAGKGHERYQVIGTEKRPFDERDVVAECLARAEAK